MCVNMCVCMCIYCIITIVFPCGIQMYNKTSYTIHNTTDNQGTGIGHKKMTNIATHLHNTTDNQGTGICYQKMTRLAT